MKRIILLLNAMLTMSCFAQQQQNLDSKVTNVTLFISGAQVTRTAQATLPPGLSELTFTGLSESIDANTIRLTGEGSFTIISVNSRMNYLKGQSNIKDEESLNSKKKQLETLLEDIASQQEVLATEENLLRTNQKIGSPEKGTTTAELKAAADFFRIRFTELSEKKLSLSRKVESTRDELRRINDQLGLASQKEVKPTGEIIVQVMAKEQVVAKFKLSYLVMSASWNPEFDLRLDDISQPIELSRRAKISQNSGEEWKDIKLTLSTGNPNESGTEPRLSTWYLGSNIFKSQSAGYYSGFKNNNPVIEKPFVGYTFNGSVSGRIYSLEDGSPVAGATVLVKGTTTGAVCGSDGRYNLDARNGSELVCSMIGMEPVTTRIDNPVINIGMVQSAVNIEAVTVTALGIPREDRQLGYASSGNEKRQEVILPRNLEIEPGSQQQVRSVKEYTISMPMNMPSDGKQYNLVIGAETIKADYEFHAVPKFERDAFLVAKVINWQDYDLLDATAGIFYEGTFTGKTKLSASMATDTLDISLGRDKSIMIERKKVKDYSSSQLFGSNRTVQRGWEISLRNNKKQPVRLIVFDQYPVSKEKGIDIELSDDGGAQVFKESGLLRWEVTLDPGQLKKLKFRYSVKYPKDLILSIE